MYNTKNLIEDLTELRESIQNEYISIDTAAARLREVEHSIDSIKADSQEEKSGILKSFLITFNISNFSDITIIFAVKNSIAEIIEVTGDRLLCEKIKDFLKDDPQFYKGIERIEIKGEYYRLFFESMIVDDTLYTVMSLTLSFNFRSTRFHILCDIVMDFIRSGRKNRHGLFNDLFDDTVIEFTGFMSLFEKSKPDVYFLKYEYISEFLRSIGLATIIEMSQQIKINLKEFFGRDSSIIRLSMSSFVVIVSSGPETSEFKKIIKKQSIDFSFKGIILPYTVIQVPYEEGNSIYDIFENVSHLNNYIKTGDVRL